MNDIDKAISEISDLISDHPVFLDGSSMTGPEAWVKALGVCVGILTKLKSKAAVPKESCDTVSQNRTGKVGMKQEMDVLSKRDKWLNVLTDEQRDIRKQRRYDEINLTDQQKETLGEEGCCWVESPTFYAESKWCG